MTYPALPRPWQVLFTSYQGTPLSGWIPFPSPSPRMMSGNLLCDLVAVLHSDSYGIHLLRCTAPLQCSTLLLLHLPVAMFCCPRRWLQHSTQCRGLSWLALLLSKNVLSSGEGDRGDSPDLSTNQQVVEIHRPSLLMGLTDPEEASLPSCLGTPAAPLPKYTRSPWWQLKILPAGYKHFRDSWLCFCLPLQHDLRRHWAWLPTYTW